MSKNCLLFWKSFIQCCSRKKQNEKWLILEIWSIGRCSFWSRRRPMAIRRRLLPKKFPTSLTKLWWTNIRIQMKHRICFFVLFPKMRRIFLWWGMSNKVSIAFVRQCPNFFFAGGKKAPNIIEIMRSFPPVSHWTAIFAAALALRNPSISFSVS